MLLLALDGILSGGHYAILQRVVSLARVSPQNKKRRAFATMGLPYVSCLIRATLGRRVNITDAPHKGESAILYRISSHYSG